MEIIIGTYEEFLVGFKLTNKNEKFILEQSFTNHAHNGSIRSVAICNKYLASGSIDEVIQLINLKHRVETGSLVSHTGTITSLEFLRTAYLFSGSDDGNICIWNTQKWQCEKILRGHKDSITSINLHSSGKLLLSISKDKTLRTWNLIKGRCAYIVNLKEVGHQVLWSPTCIYFAVVFEKHIDFYDISDGAIKYQIDQKLLNLNKRFNKIVFIDDNHVIISSDSQELITFKIDENKIVNRFEAHENRIKDLVLIDLETINDEILSNEKYDKSKKWLFTASSDGFIKIWSIDFDTLEKPPSLICQVDTTCRPTCMTVWISNDKYEKFKHFTVPELKISQDELEKCKDKLKAKKQSKIIINDDNNDNEEDVYQNVNNKNKKIKLNSVRKNTIDPDQSADEEIHEGLKIEAEEDEDDDDEAIRSMKVSSKISRRMSKKSSKRNAMKRNITTFKMRKMLKQKKSMMNNNNDNNRKNSSSKVIRKRKH